MLSLPNLLLRQPLRRCLLQKPQQDAKVRCRLCLLLCWHLAFPQKSLYLPDQPHQKQRQVNRGPLSSHRVLLNRL